MLRPGVLVTLLSGGPVMTVKKVSPEGNWVDAQWFDLVSGTFKVQSFDVGTLAMIRHIRLEV